MNAPIEHDRSIQLAIQHLNLSDPIPSWITELANSPVFLQDTTMNIKRAILRPDALTCQVKLTLATVVARHAGYREVSETFAMMAMEAGATSSQLHDAAGIAATTTSFNVSHAFRAMVAQGDDTFESLRVGLRSSTMITSNKHKDVKELIAIVISTINGCSRCVHHHIELARELGVSTQQIDEAVRTAAIVMSICSFLPSSNASSNAQTNGRS